MHPCRIVIADDHDSFREGLKKLLGARPDLEIIGELADGFQLFDLLNQTLPDMLLLELSVLNHRGTEAIREIKRAYPRIKILILTINQDKHHLEQAICAGARGYLLKEAIGSELLTAIDKIRRGRIYVSQDLLEELTEDWVQTLQNKSTASPKMEQLTLREREILKLITEGKGNKQIAAVLLISTRTVERHRASIMHKLEAKRTTDIVSQAIQRGYV